MRVLYNGTGDSKYRPCPLLVQYVDAGEPSSVATHCCTVPSKACMLPLRQRTAPCAGWLGKKAYKGVYTYAKPLN